MNSLLQLKKTQETVLGVTYEDLEFKYIAFKILSLCISLSLSVYPHCVWCGVYVLTRTHACWCQRITSVSVPSCHDVLYIPGSLVSSLKGLSICLPSRYRHTGNTYAHCCRFTWVLRAELRVSDFRSRCISHCLISLTKHREVPSLIMSLICLWIINFLYNSSYIWSYEIGVWRQVMNQAGTSDNSPWNKKRDWLGTLSYKLCLVWHTPCIFRVLIS